MIKFKFISNILKIIFIFFIFNSQSIAQKINLDEFTVNKYLKTKLSPGDWYLATKERDSYYGLWFDDYTLVKIESENVIEIISIGLADVAGVYESIVNTAVQEIMYRNKHDGCYERPEYYLLVLYKRGNTVNCMRVRHLDTNKELNFPDDPEVSNAQLKKWLKDNKVKLPKIMLWSSHVYFSRLARGQMLELVHVIDPNLLNSPKITKFTEESSEFHKNNINNFPEHKKIMEKWISIAAKRHREFEKNAKIRKHHALDLDKYIN